jgi:hypothetical protein
VISELEDRVMNALSTFGEDTLASFTGAAQPLVLWIDHFERSGSGCEVLLSALRGVIAEACACATMSLVRPALSLLRSEIDVALAWLYYSEHPREWRVTNASDSGFKLKKELLQVFETIDPCFKRRFGLLKQVMKRKIDDPYRLLSAHVHLQSEVVLPTMTSLADIVQPGLTTQVVELQSEVTEYISDLFFAMYAGDWVALPTELTTTLQERMQTPSQYGEFMREAY